MTKEIYPYTVTKKTDADLAGVAGRLVMQFVDGSCIEVRKKDVITYKYHQFKEGMTTND